MFFPLDVAHIAVASRERPPCSRFRGMRPRPAVLALLVLLTGCFTGQRPSFSPDPFAPGSRTGNEAIDQVLAQLDATNDGPYTAEYTVLTKFGNTSRPATVAVDTGRRSVTIGSVRFLTVNGTSQTCLLDTSKPCSSTIDPARISDTQITPDFYAADVAKRLRRAAVALVAPVVSHIEEIAGQTSTCVDVPLGGGTSVFCVLSNGPLARLDDGAVAVNLTRYTPSADESLFATTKTP